MATEKRRFFGVARVSTHRTDHCVVMARQLSPERGVEGFLTRYGEDF